MFVGLLADGLANGAVSVVGGEARAGEGVHPSRPPPLLRNTTESPVEWRRALAERSGGWAFDVGWAHRSAAAHVPPAVNEPALAYLGSHLDRIAAVILHDATEKQVNLPLGRGDVALQVVAQALRECGIRVPIYLDVEGDATQSLELARALFESDR
jgi:sugar phosphate isomerase/epimerase